MIRLFRFSPSRLALVYVMLGVLVLGVFAIPLWYVWRANYWTLRTYVHAEDVQRMVDIFEREGAKGLAAAIDARVGTSPRDEIMLLADPSRVRVAGNVRAWPSEVPDSPGTSGLVIDLGGSPGGYRLLMGRESARFQSLVDLFWYGIAGATGTVLVLGAAVGWMIRRALLSEVHEISGTASAIVEGDFSRRVAVRGGSDELDTLARTVNGMLEQLAGQNVALEGEIAVRRQAEQALHRAHDDLEGLVAQRTAQVARANESLRRSETYLAEAQRLSLTGSFGWNVARGELFWSDETYPEEHRDDRWALLRRVPRGAGRAPSPRPGASKGGGVMITRRPSPEHGRADHGWLDTRHTFSFARYYDPRYTGFRDLVVINEDRVQPSRGFGAHAHADMEILSYVLEGALEHRDSLGTGSIIRPGDVQRMTAGTGVTHSEFNPSATEPVHFLQIWLTPDEQDLAPSYEQRTFAPAELRGTLKLIGAKDGRDGALTINQDVEVFASRLEPGTSIAHKLRPGRHAWIQIIDGALDVNGTGLSAGDGAAVSDEAELRIRAETDAHFLLFDLA